jgi:hypothetical protein
MIPYVMPKQTLYRGDKWEDVYHIGPMADTITGLPPGNPCLSCRIQFRDKTTHELGYELNSAAATGKGIITIVDSVNYEFDIPPQALNLNAGTYEWDFETFEVVGCVGNGRTFLKGTFVIIQDISHD